MKRGAAVLALVAAGAIGACNTSTQGVTFADSFAGGHDGAKSFVSVRLITLFRQGVNPADSAFLAQLSRKVGTSLAYIGPVSGGVHILRASVPPESVTDLVRRLRNSPEVADVRLDIPVRPQ